MAKYRLKTVTFRFLAHAISGYEFVVQTKVDYDDFNQQIKQGITSIKALHTIRTSYIAVSKCCNDMVTTVIT